MYGNIIPELRIEYHHLLGDYYRKNYQAKEEYAPVIAHHLYEGDEKEEALPYLIRAGDVSTRLFANQNALDYYEKAQEVLEMQPEPDENQLVNLYDRKAGIFARISRYKEGKELVTSSIDLTRKLKDRRLEESH